MTKPSEKQKQNVPSPVRKAQVKNVQWLTLAHQNGQAKKVVQVTHAASVPKLTINWPLAGSYILDLKRNEIQRARFWGAHDIKAAWKIWYDMKPTRSYNKKRSWRYGT